MMTRTCRRFYWGPNKETESAFMTACDVCWVMMYDNDFCLLRIAKSSVEVDTLWALFWLTPAPLPFPSVTICFPCFV